MMCGLKTKSLSIKNGAILASEQTNVLLNPSAIGNHLHPVCDTAVESAP